MNILISLLGSTLDGNGKARGAVPLECLAPFRSSCYAE